MFYIYTDTEKNTDIYNFFNKVTAYTVLHTARKYGISTCVDK